MNRMGGHYTGSPLNPKIHCESKMPDKIFKINECCICLLDPPGIVFSCGHLICCKNCSDKYKEKTCPLCKGYITDRIIYSGSYNLDVD
jgi:hypothetical protein